MASAIAGVRFVRCPKCDKVLAEFGQVPVYRCGGCGTVLRAKVRASTAETTVRGSALEKDSQTPTESSSSISSFVNKSASLANQADTSLEAGNGMQRVAQSDHHRVLNSNADSDSNGKEELIEKGKNRTNERRYEDSSSAVTAENLPEKGNQVIREMENSLRDLHDSSLNEKKEESSYRVDNDIKFTSLAYDASDSSRDEQPLSRRRRVRHEKASGKDGSTEKGTPRPRTQGIPAELPNEMSYATGHRRPLERDTTFGSADFHSVQNWMGSEIDDEDLITLSKELLFPGDSEPDHMKILRKVDELRDELREFLTKTSEGKNQDPHFKPREKPKLPPRVPKVPTQNGESENCRKAAKKKKKQTTIKQYFRPVCGGAPFVICYKCWTLLQLPADFLVSGKTLHKLECGACSETLVFSFRHRGRTDAPLTPAEAQHPPSEVDARADPISPSSESCSPELNEPVHNVSRSSSYSSVRQGRLHRLLGYSSASDILFRREDGYVDGGNNSSGTSTPQFYRPPRDDRRRRYGQYGGTGITSTSKSPEIQEVEESSSPRRRGSAIGLLKKGMREFSHGLENVKLKVHSRG